MDLHNSAMYSGKAIELDKDTFGTVNSWPNENRKGEDFIGVEKGESSFAPGASVCFGQPIVGLKLGMPKETENLSSTASSKTSVTAKRTRVSYQSMQTSRCQVEGCNLDLTSAKDYHRRHRICESHSKSPKVIVAGVERRFCQQCSRFHNLSEFDDKKRSCRRRLSDHNARRRRPQPDAMHLSSMELSSSFYDRRPPNFLLNRMPSSSSSITWESSSSLKIAQAGISLIRNSGNVDMKPNLPAGVPNAISNQELDMGSLCSFRSSVGADASAANSQSHLNEAPNLPRALSLLSTTTWGLNEPESTSLEQLMQGSVSIAQPAMPLESQNWPLISASHVSAEQAPPLSSPFHSVASQSTNGSHFQNFRSFKPPYESGFHFSSRIN